MATESPGHVVMAYSFNQGDRPLSGYTIQRGVGRGGFGEVYYAVSDGGKEVALKYLRDNPSVELRGVSHCLNLKSPHLVDIFDVRQSDRGDWFVIMEFVNGPSLRDMMNDAPAGLGPDKAAYFVREVARGLAYLHDRGIVHRDLKPGNVFYDEGYVKIGDYGLSKFMAASQHSGQTVSVGTVHYMAPEIGSGNYDRTIDIYALGVMLYEMLLGKVPFVGSSVGEILMKHLTAQPALDALPQPYPEVIRKALAKDPNDRYQTVQEMISAIFASADLDRSVALLEPASLTLAAQRAVKAALVVGAGGVGSSNVGLPSPGGAMTPPPVIDPLRGGNREVAIERVSPSPVAPPAPAGPAPAPVFIKERIGQALLLAVGTALSIALLKGGGPWYGQVGTALGQLTIMVQAVMVGCWLGREWLARDRSADQNQWVVRLMIVALTAIPMVMVSPLGPSSKPLLPVLGLMLLGEWEKRYYAGRRGSVSKDWAFSAGLFGFVTALVFDAGAVSTGLLCAGASMTLQLFAGAWPLPRGAYVPPAGEPKANGADKPDSDGPSDGPFIVARVGIGLEEPGVDAAKAPSFEPKPSPSSRPTRGRLARTTWLLAGLACLCSAVGLFIAAGMAVADTETGGFCIGGVYALGFGFASLTQSGRFRRRGSLGSFAWPARFLGLATIAAGAIAIGMMGGGEPALGFLPVCFLGLSLFLLPWIWPRPDPEAPAPSAEMIIANQRMRGGWMLGIGIVLLISLGAYVPLILHVVSPELHDTVIPATTVPIVMVAFIIGGMGIAKLTRYQLPGKATLALPLRRWFETDMAGNLGALIERHFAGLGYSLASRGDLSWSFQRGSALASVWDDSSLSRLKTSVNIAIFELDDGRHRITVFADIATQPWQKPKQQHLRALLIELYELRDLLRGREVTPDSNAMPVA